MRWRNLDQQKQYGSSSTLLGAESHKLVKGIEDMWVKVLGEEQRAKCLAVALHLSVVLCVEEKICYIYHLLTLIS